MPFDLVYHAGHFEGVLEALCDALASRLGYTDLPGRRSEARACVPACSSVAFGCA
ncbi:MAG: hypothetical protein IAE99_07650 [Rhodothermales bacterium]|nr:hypothetical protein [Rhodothermales bacterium]